MMANKDDYLTSYREFFEYFAQTVNPNDQLPVKLGSYKLLNVEVIGGIIDWTTQYLSQKKCPSHLFSPLIKIIIEEIRKACKKQPLNYGFNPTDNVLPPTRSFTHDSTLLEPFWNNLEYYNSYEPLKLMQAVMAKTNEVCLRYLDNSMLCSLPAPSNTYYETSICAVRNRRRKMEDRHVAIPDLNTMFNIQEASPSSYYAIFDGHAGHDAAAYSAAHLHQFLAENKYFISDPERALLDAFCKTDALFLEKCHIESLSGGTTAVVALLRPKENTLYIAWVGDSQALLVNQGKVLQCVVPHKPCRKDERERIEKAGGCVMLWGTWRVNGQLAVSRAIGDADYKPHVIAIPDVREVPLDGGEDFLIIACDGLWDVISEDAAAQEVYYMIGENPDDTERISKHLVQLARYQGSTDNISVIVVFLREPHQIAAEAHRWATRNGPSLTTNNMETGLDNANNPFTNSNGSLKNLDVDTDNIGLQKNNDGLLLNLTDNFKANGTDISQDIFVTEKSNGTKKSASDVHFDGDFGPETDVDAVDDAFSPVEKCQSSSDDFVNELIDKPYPATFNEELKEFCGGLFNNNPPDEESNPVLNNQQKEDIAKVSEETDIEEFQGANRDETPTPPADTVHDVGGLDVNPADSDSEDEWNYIKGDQAKPDNLSSQPETVVETSEQDDAMSQLNPNAAEFVPVSPTRSIPSPACLALINDEVISESPKRPVRVDINVPSETEFESEVKSRPSDFDYKNGHDSENENDASGIDKIESILNGKNIDEIPEFHPGSTPMKLPAEEFHFGPNAAPFAPRVLDQSEAFSTKANFGDDTEQTLNVSFNDSELALPNKEQADPMSTSFYAEKGESNPFQDDEDLNKVHELPENMDAFLQDVTVTNKENVKLERSDFPLEKPLDNDQAAIQTTDLDKISQDDEKELASPLEYHDDLSDANPATDVPSHDFQLNSLKSNLLDDFAIVSEKPQSDDSNIASLPELEPVDASAPEPEPAVLSPQPPLTPVASSVEDVLCMSPTPLNTSSPIPEGEHDLLQSPLPEHNLPQSPLPENTLPQSPLPEHDLPRCHLPQSPLPEHNLVQSPLPSETHLVNTEEVSSDNLLRTSIPDQLNVDQLSRGEESMDSQILAPEAKSPVYDSEELSNDNLLELNVQDHIDVDQLSQSEGKLESQSPAGDFRPESKSPAIDFEESTSPVCELNAKTCEAFEEIQFDPKSEVENINVETKESQFVSELAASPVLACEYSAEPESCQFTPQDVLIPESQSPIDLVQEQKQEEEVTSSVKDDVSSPVDQFSPIKSPESLIEEPVNPDDTNLESNEVIEIQHEEESKNAILSQEITGLDFLSDMSCPLPVPQPLVEPQVESSLLNVLEASAPEEPIKTALSNGFDTFASEFNEQICIKTDNITPEFAEPAVITPSEESKAIDEIVALSPVESHTETVQKIESFPSELEPAIPQPEPLIPQIEEPKLVEAVAETLKETLAPLPVVPVTPLEAKQVKAEEKKSASTGKKPIGKVDVRKSAPLKVGAPKAPSKPTASSPKPGVASKLPPKTGTTKTFGVVSKTASTTASKPLPKPKTATAPKTTEKKPLANDVKPASKTTLAKKPTEAPATRTITRPAATAAKTSPTKTAPRPTTAPRTLAPKTTTSTIPPKPTAAAKPRVPLASKSTTAAAAVSKTTTTSAKTTTTRTISSPKTAAPRTFTSTAPKPRVPLAKTVTKSADVEKEKKESANKLTASRSTTAAKTASGTATSRITTTTVKKTEIKPLSDRTVASKTTTTRTTIQSKKPGDTKTALKTKTTKIEKPKQNGVAPTNITEEIKEITIINNVVNETENLIKDNSPLDNKLIVETNNALIDTNSAD